MSPNDRAWANGQMLWVRGPVNLPKNGLAPLERLVDAAGFSLRLGANATYSYAYDEPHVIPALTPVRDRVRLFDWTTEQWDFNYPLELSSSVHRGAGKRGRPSFQAVRPGLSHSGCGVCGFYAQRMPSGSRVDL
jgi:hypothetical protein